jgi:two-component system, NtrC family, response regulator HydG
MPFLTFHVEHGGKIHYALKSGTHLFGRGEGCHLLLTGDDVSRRHFAVQVRSGQCLLRDRSTNGTLVDDEPIEGSVPLEDGMRIRFGSWLATFHTEEDTATRHTTTRIRPPAWSDEVVHADEDGLVEAAAMVRFVGGRQEGLSHVIRTHAIDMGGPGAGIELDPDLPRRALRLRVTRGRAMVDPSPDVPVYVAGGLAPTLMPVLDGEEVRLGQHRFVVETRFADHTHARTGFGEMVGSAPAMRRAFGLMARMALHDHPVLVLGESGTGKELAARALHEEGPRAGGPFEPVNCATLPRDLVESTLFGHVKGAFTGATETRDGAFHRADGGTLFLDEIGELAPEAQAKLLRALESGEIRRVGGGAASFPRVRVVAATHRDLGEMVREGTFRQDLFFRLSVLTVRLPPLRDRIADLPLLARTIVERHLEGATLTEGAIARLQRHHWPGNVRELRNVLTRAFVIGGPVIEASHLSFQEGSISAAGAVAAGSGSAEAGRIRAALARTRGNRAAAARVLGMPRSSLLYKMRKWEIR